MQISWAWQCWGTSQMAVTDPKAFNLSAKKSVNIIEGANLDCKIFCFSVPFLLFFKCELIVNLSEQSRWHIQQRKWQQMKWLTVLKSIIFLMLSSYDVCVRTPGVRRVYQKTYLFWTTKESKTNNIKPMGNTMAIRALKYYIALSIL